MYIIEDNGKFGLFSCGKMVVPQIADQFYEPCNGVVEFMDNGKHGLYDQVADIYVEPVYDAMEVDEHENYKVTLEGQEGYLDAEDGHFVPAAEAEDPDYDGCLLNCDIRL